MIIYQVENLLNHKKYIGSTNDFERRKKEHLQAARLESCKSYNYPLQKAIRKYGKENFIFSILEECEKNETAIKERFYIEKMNSLVNTGHGYNQTINTECALQDKNIIVQNIIRTGQKCALVDSNYNIQKIYNSYHECARVELGKNEATLVRKICKGEARSNFGKIFCDLDSDGKVIIPEYQTRKRRKAVIGISIYDETDIVYYNSISEAAREENIDRGSISKCISGSTRYSNVGKRIWRKVGDDLK